MNRPKKIAYDPNEMIFEHPDHWDGATRSEPMHLARNNLLVGLIPPDVRSILDVGCGEGSFLETAARRGFNVYGIDRSHAAAKATHIPIMTGDITCIPFKNRSWDLVSCIEVLEHLDDATLSGAVKELTRVSSKYLLVAVPYREQLINQLAKCSSCGCVFHAWGHLRAFKSFKAVMQLFEGWQTVATAGCGYQTVFTYPGLAHARKFCFGLWTWERSTVCPKCRGNIPEQTRRLPRFLNWLLEGIEWRAVKSRSPWWMMIVLERTS
jgi:SAM-dependent methyltransferase